MLEAAFPRVPRRDLSTSAPSQGVADVLYKRTSQGGRLAYLADWDGGSTRDKMDHLVCFVPGMLALGAFYSAGTPGEKTAPRDLEMGMHLSVGGRAR